MIYMLSMELFGTSLAIDDFPLSKRIVGLGLSDWDVYAEKLATKFDYTNTFLDQDPRLDIRIPDDSLDGTVDFMIASDVFEHVPPPVSPCFKNARRMLKDHGVLIFSVPYTAGDGITKEHYPALYDFEIEDRDGTRVLVNRTKAGAVEEFEDPVFHGGSGLTLEMRVFTESSLLEEFRRAAFEPVKVHRGPDFGHGIYWGVDWSLPMAARAGPMGARSWSGRGAGASRRRLGSPALKAAQRGAASSARVATFGAHSSLPATNE